MQKNNALASSPPRSGPAWRRPVLIGLVALAVIGYAIFLGRHMSPHAGGSDASGYCNNARLLAQGRLDTLPRVLPGHTAEEFSLFSNVPLGFILKPDGRMVPTYPAGYPLQLLVVAAGVGWAEAASVLNLITALIAGGLLYVYCRWLGLNVGLSLGGVGMLWLCPLFIFSSVQPLSDLSALAWALAVLYGAGRARDGWQWGLLCGVAMGVAVLVRPTNLLLAVPVLVALGDRPRSWPTVIAGGLPSAAFLAFYNWRMYGSPLLTGYGDIRSIVSAGYLPHNLAHFAYWIPMLLSPLILLALAAPFVAAGRQRGFAVLVAWALVLIGFYVFYYFSGETWWYLRFILPAFPVLIVGALLVLQTVWQRFHMRPVLVAVVLSGLLIAAAGWQLRQLRQLDVLRLEQGERTYPAAARWAKENLPPSSAVFCMQVSGAFFYYTDFMLFRWEQILPEKFDPLLAALAQQNRPVIAALFPFEQPEALERIGGRWTKLTTVGQVTFYQRQP